MDKIEKLKSKLAHDHFENGGSGGSFKTGWEAAMELQLPVLFHRWADKLGCGEAEDIGKFMGDLEDESMYQYWITNIYKPDNAILSKL